MHISKSLSLSLHSLDLIGIEQIRHVGSFTHGEDRSLHAGSEVFLDGNRCGLRSCLHLWSEDRDLPGELQVRRSVEDQDRQ